MRFAVIAFYGNRPAVAEHGEIKAVALPFARYPMLRDGGNVRPPKFFPDNFFRFRNAVKLKNVF